MDKNYFEQMQPFGAAISEQKIITPNEYAHMVVKNFITKYPLAHKAMQQTSHNEPTMLSDWHLEGSIWTHTMMVLSFVCHHANQTTSNYKMLLLAALLHDIGKVHTREIKTDKEKVTFYGHSGVSTFIARDLLDQLDPFLTTYQKIYTLRLINLHQILFNVNDDMSDKSASKFIAKFNQNEDSFLFNDISYLRKADTAGRISIHPGVTTSKKLEELETTLLYMNRTATPRVNESLPNAVILVGLPGAGKSTYAKQNFPHYTLISRDAQIENLAPGLPYNEAFNTVDQKEADALYEHHFSTTMGKLQNLVIDKTNLTHKSRMKSITRLQAKRYNVQVIVLMPTLETIYQRNLKRVNKTIPQKVIHRMMTTFEMPFQNEGQTEYLF